MSCAVMKLRSLIWLAKQHVRIKRRKKTIQMCLEANKTHVKLLIEKEKRRRGLVQRWYILYFSEKWVGV